MNHTYQISGMTCSSCKERVKASLLQLKDVKHVEVSKNYGTATLTMDKPISNYKIQRALPPKYRITPSPLSSVRKTSRNWALLLKPFSFIYVLSVLTTLVVLLGRYDFGGLATMQYYVPGFFLITSFLSVLTTMGIFINSMSMDILTVFFV